jgi:hypothetical protein
MNGVSASVADSMIMALTSARSAALDFAIMVPNDGGYSKPSQLT